VRDALESPLLNDFDLKTAKNVLVNITVGRNENGLQMKQLEEINSLIKEYTGNANNFKRGIVFDDSPEFGDRVNITVIATGFKMSMISEITDGNLGNIIVIDNDFVYKRNESTSSDGIELPEVRSEKIGYNNTAVRKKIIFEEGQKPALLVSEGESRSELEHTAAIRRKTMQGQKREE
jgi:cell division protein FtsZ